MLTAGLIQLGVLAAMLFAVVASVAVTVVYPRLRWKLARVAPTERARWVLALCVLPTASAVGLTALCFLPSMFDVLWPGLDHCPRHLDGHAHLCLSHPPPAPGTAVGWALPGALAAVLALCLAQRLARMGRSWKALRQLAQTAVFEHGRGVWIVESEIPLAVTCGLFRCRILVSTALLDSLSPALVDAVVEHERAHVRRRDVLVNVVASVLSLTHLPPARRALLADLDLAAEQACDEAAAIRLDDRLQLAQALLALERLLLGTQARFGLAGVSFGGSSVALRIETLLAEPTTRAPHNKTRRWLVGAAAAATALLLLADPLHHLTETILGSFAR
jgi:Zn-dependent protease with chaperone function